MRKNPWKNLVYRKMMLKKRREVWTRPGFRKKHQQGVQKAANNRTEEQKKKKSASLRRVWSRKSEKEKAEIGKKISKKTTEQNIRQWADPKWAAKMTKIRQEQGQKLENKRKLSIGGKKAWRRKDYRQKQAKTRAKSFAYRVIRHQKISKALIGRPSWNAGQTKETHPALARLSKRLMGQVPDWKKYGKWYQRGSLKIWMRSSWEVLYAQWMDRQGIQWEYEPKFFVVGKGSWVGQTYTPDFYIPAEKKFMEVKGHLSRANARKMLAFRKRHPKVVVELLGGKELKALGVL